MIWYNKRMGASGNSVAGSVFFVLYIVIKMEDPDV